MIMYPTEYVKTVGGAWWWCRRRRRRRRRLSSAQILQLDAGAAGQRVYSGSWHCAKQTMAQHGVAGLYRGMSSLLYGSIPKSAVRFTTFEVLKNAVCDERGHISRGQTLMCGLGAGVAEVGHTHTHTRADIHIHTHTYTYTYVHTQLPLTQSWCRRPWW